MSKRKTSRAWAGLGFEVLALLTAIAVAVALTRDHRATSLHIASVWVAVAITTVPPFLTVVGTRHPLLIDVSAALALLIAIVGSFTIGGIALGASAFLLVVAGVMHHLVTPAGQDLKRPVSIGAIVLGALAFLAGITSMSAGIMIAPIGLLLVAWGASTLGSAPRSAGTNGDAV